MYRAVGHASVALDPLRAWLATESQPIRTGRGPLDKTGLVGGGDRPQVLHDDADVLWASYDSFAHSFWRAQELSLFKAYRHFLHEPMLDFGGGDGSFAGALFAHVGICADVDAEALAAARRAAVYGRLLHVTTEGIPLDDGAAGSIMSNSVLEHVVHLPHMLTELRRVLRPGGTLLATVPVPTYTEHLRHYFGARAAERINRESAHHNLLEPAEWGRLLEHHGFRVEVLRSYQPPEFTFWYRMFRLLGSRGLSRFWPGLPRQVWKRAGDRLVQMVRASITQTVSGANIFMVAR